MLKLFLICWLLGEAIAVEKQRQLKLEDIERDNLATERKLKNGNHYLPTRGNEPPTPPKMQYGFVPIQQSNYPTQQQQQINQQVTQVAYTPTRTTSAQSPKYTYVQQSQAHSPLYTQAILQSYQQTAPQQFSYDDQQENYQNVYVPQQQLGVQYVVNNDIQYVQSELSQPQQQPQQYYYLQQYPSASDNNIQAVADEKGNVQYIMYVPAGYLQQSQEIQPQPQAQISHNKPDEADINIESLLKESFPQGDVQYSTLSGKAQPPVVYQSYNSHQQKQYSPKYTSVSFAGVNSNKQKSSGGYREPTSLLDSYIPSIVQYQYYKQQQQQSSLNAIKQDSVKHINVGKPEYPKYKGVRHEATNLSYNYYPNRYARQHKRPSN